MLVAMISSRAIRRLAGTRYPLILIGCASLSACTTLGPDYQEPEIAWLADWQTELYGQVQPADQQAAADLDFWWRLFDDPALNGLIETARKENLSLQTAGLRILEARAALGIADSTRFPQAQQVTAGATSATTADIDDGSTDSFGNYQVGFGLGWEFDFWGRFRRSIESADATFFASIANQQNLQALLSAQTADLYYRYLTTQLRIAVAQENAELQRRSLEITQKLYTSGQDSELDLQQARTQYLSTLASIPALERTLVNVRNALAALLNRPPGEIPELAELPQDLPGVPRLVIGEVPARLLARRPDVRTSAWQVAAQSAQIGVAQADYYPAISLLGSITLASDSISLTPDSATLAVGPSLTWNVFDYGRIRNNIRLQDARLQQAILAYQSTVLQAAREIDDAAIGVVKTYEQREILAASVSAAERSLELARSRYREGYADFQRVIEAQRALLTQAQQELTNRGDHISAVIELYRALGGGWIETPVGDLVPEAVRDTMRERSRWGELLDAPLPTGVERPPSAGGNARR
jgi:NodT family efflux transporter outer membrane factor (OMF) lipoprotein